MKNLTGFDKFVEAKKLAESAKNDIIEQAEETKVEESIENDTEKVEESVEENTEVEKVEEKKSEKEDKEEKKEDDKEEKAEDKEEKKDEKKEDDKEEKSETSDSDEDKYLTAGQKKLPEGLKKSLIAKAKKKGKKVEESIEIEEVDGELAIAESAQIHTDGNWKVRSRFDVPNSLVNAYIKKVSDETGEDIKNKLSPQEIVEDIVDYISNSFLSVENLPTSIVSATQKAPQVQTQEAMPQETQVQAQVQEPTAQVQPDVQPDLQTQPDAQNIAQEIPQTQAQPQSQIQGGQVQGGQPQIQEI